MRFLLLCCSVLALAGCGADPSTWRESALGSWTLTSFQGTDTCGGMTSTTSTIGAANMLLIEKGAANTDVKGTFGGREILKAVMTSPSAFDVGFNSYTTKDSDCSYSISWKSGSGKIERFSRLELTLDMVGDKDAFCTIAPNKSCSSQLHLVATKN